MKNSGRIFSLLGGFGLVIGALLPWAIISSYTLGVSRGIMGYDGDGLLTAILGILVIIIGFTTSVKPNRPFSIFITLLSILSLILIFPKLFTLSESNLSSPSEDIYLSLGVGIFVSLFAGIFSAIGGLLSSQYGITDANELLNNQ